MTTPRPTRPYAYLFDLGPDARVGTTRLPRAMTTVPCYVYRAADVARAQHLDAIAEPPVDEAIGELVLQAIEGVVERRGILHELCTDAELAVERAPGHTNGFHAGVSMEQAREALARGGFVVHVLEDDEAGAGDDPRALEALARHLDLASLEVTLRSIAAREEELPFHAAAVEDILEAALARADVEAFTAGAAARVAGLDPELRDLAVLLAAGIARRARGERAPAAQALLAALPPPGDPRVRKAAGGRARTPGPRRPPRP